MDERPSRGGTTSEQSAEAAVPTLSQSAGKMASVLATATGRRAKQAALQGHLKKLAMIDLPSRVAELGHAALEQGVNFSGHDELRSKLQVLRTAEANLAKHRGLAAFRAKAELLANRQAASRMQREAGEAVLREFSDHDPALPSAVAAALAEVRKIHAIQANLNQKAHDLGSQIEADSSMSSAAGELLNSSSRAGRAVVWNRSKAALAAVVAVACVAGYLMRSDGNEQPAVAIDQRPSSSPAQPKGTAQARAALPQPPNMLDAIQKLPPVPSENQLVAYLGPPASTALEVDSMMGLQRWVYYWDEPSKRAYVFLVGLNPEQSFFKVARQLNVYDGPLVDPKDPGANGSKGLRVPEWLENMSLLRAPKFKDGSPGPGYAYLAVRREPWNHGHGRSEFQNRLNKLPKLAKPEQAILVIGEPDMNTRASWFSGGTPVLRRLHQYKGADGVYVIEFERDPESTQYHEATSAFVTADFIPEGSSEPPKKTEAFDVQFH